jgi:mono/diheme cytochrome c family protein
VRSSTARPLPGGRVKLARRAPVLLALLGLLLVLAGCIPSTYEYPVDYYHEMHYQEAYRRQEPPLYSVAEGAVPQTGAEPALSAAQLATVPNPITNPTQEDLAAAAQLYQRNCSVCHGPEGKGDGIIAAYFRDPRYNAPAPKPYDDPTVLPKTDGELFAIVTHGLRNEETLVGMPAFRKLLSERERWLLVLQIRAFQGRQ